MSDNIQNQIQKMVDWSARELLRNPGTELPETPEWLGPEAISWIRGHYFEFSDLVVAAHENVTGNQNEHFHAPSRPTGPKHA